jgi:ATP-binding cassette, subfamily C, bacterial CydD
MNRDLLRQVRSARASLGLTAALGLLSAGATIAQMVFLSKVVDRVFLKGADLGEASTLLLLLLGAAVLRSGLLWTREVAAQRGAVRIKSEIRERLFAHILRLGPSYAKGERTGELATTATEGVEKLEAYFARYVPQTVLSVFVPLLIACYIFPQDWSSAILLLITAPVIPVIMILVGSYAEEHMRRQWAALSRMGAGFLDALQGLTTLKILGRSAAESEKVAATSEEFRRRTMKVLRYAFLSGFVLEFMIAAAIGLVAVTLGVRLISGSMPFEEAFVVLLLAPEFYKPLRELGAHRHAGMEGRAAADRIFEILSTPCRCARAWDLRTLPQVASPSSSQASATPIPPAIMRPSQILPSPCLPGLGPPSSGTADRARALWSTCSCVSWIRSPARSWRTASR